MFVEEFVFLFLGLMVNNNEVILYSCVLFLYVCIYILNLIIDVDFIYRLKVWDRI